jgi:hypothetical protein
VEQTEILNRANQLHCIPILPALAAVTGLLGAWIAAGSAGLFAAPLRITFTWLALIVVVILAGLPKKKVLLFVLAAAIVLLLPVFVPTGPIHDTLCVVLFLSALATGQEGPAQRLLLVSASACFCLALFRLACDVIPAVWLLSDAVASLLGRCATAISGGQLDVGATFAGVDFLVLSLAFAAGWIGMTEGPRWERGCYAVGAIGGVHLVYLIVLSFTADVLESLPNPPVPPFQHPYVPPAWSWAKAVPQLLPWNLPVIAAGLHLGVLAALLFWSNWPLKRPHPSALPGESTPTSAPPWTMWAVRYGPLLLAVLLPIIGIVTAERCDLGGKRIVANQQGQLDWRRPCHDRYGQQWAGQFGMLPVLVESLGGHLSLSSEFSNEDLVGTDLVVWLHPAGQVPPAQQERIWDFVHRGGSLLVVAGPPFPDGGQARCANEILEPTAMLVREDVALSATGNWQQACQPCGHPAAAALSGKRAKLFTDSGTSVQIGWPARPLVVGRWGWTAPGSDPNRAYSWEASERLGDLVLAAEQQYGRGTVVVLGDSFSLTNEGSVRGYEWSGRLLSYLANRPQKGHPLWQRLGTLLLLLGLLVMACWRVTAARLVGMALLLSLSSGICGRYNLEATRVVPDGRLIETMNDRLPYRLASIDVSHLESFSDGNWSFDAINGLALTLMRNGYLVTSLPEISQERLERAALVIAIAPLRPFSAAERQRLHEFVSRGGLLIGMVGAEQAAASASLLGDFGLHVPASPVPTDGPWPEPEPMGHFRSLYLDARDYGAGDYKASVIFHTAWPVEAKQSGVEALVHGKNDLPIVVARLVGQGRIVVIGDPGFALNKNLEYIGGEPFEGRYENAHFWRWLIARLTGRPEWIPPRPPAPTSAATPQRGENQK